MHTSSFKLTALAVMAAAFVSPAAMADLAGGGATLPAKAYQGDNASSTSTGPRLSQPAPGSLFYEALPLVTQSYCQTGSGTGRKVLTGASGDTDASRACPGTFLDAFVDGTNGFSAPRIDADFAGSDAPASTSDFNNFVSFKGTHRQLTQFPSIAGNIAVVANTPGAGSAASVLLTEAEVCNIFAGKITNWNQLAKNTGAPYPNKAITLAVRSDSSGTTFAFTNHLNWVCSDAALNQTLAPGAVALPFSPASNNFSVQTTFSPAAFPGGVVPAGATVVGGSGNPGVVSVVDSTDGAIGYVEAANAIALGSANVTSVKIAAVDTATELNPKDGVNTARVVALYKSGATNADIFTVPTTFTDKDGNSYSGTYTDRALQSNNATYGRPIGLPTALTTTQAPTPNCAFIVHPGAYATSAYKTAGSPSSGYKTYPIVGVTYLMGNYAGNTTVADVRTLLGSPYNIALRSGSGGPVTSVGANTGYSYLSVLKGTPLSGSPVTLNTTRVNACTK